MKYFTDGDQLVITKDDFVNLQESPAVFYPLSGVMAQAILEAGTVTALPLGELMYVRDMLALQIAQSQTAASEGGITDVPMYTLARH